MNDLQGRPHGALGVLFVRGGPAEIGQDAITHVAGDKPVVARDHIAAEGSIRVQQAAQLFGVELFTQRRRTHQVAEHHGELAAFATRGSRRNGRADWIDRRRGCRRCGIAERGDSVEQLTAVADLRDADILQVIGGQLRQHRAIDRVVAKGGFVLLQPQASQPVCDIHAAPSRMAA